MIARLCPKPKGPARRAGDCDHRYADAETKSLENGPMCLVGMLRHTLPLRLATAKEVIE